MAGAASREGLRCGLREGSGRGWGGAGWRGGAGAGEVGEVGLHGEGILHGGDDAQPNTRRISAAQVHGSGVPAARGPGLE